MAGLSGLSEEYFLKAFWRHRTDFDRGTIRGEEMYRMVLADGGVTGTEDELSSLAKRLLGEDMRSWSRASEEVTQWGLSLQKEGFKLGILSNMPFDFLELFGGTIELFTRADCAVFSCNENQIKPESAIFKTLTDRLDCRASEIVFFDDIQVNIDGARKEGIQGYLWTGLEKAKKDLSEAISRAGQEGEC